MVKSSQSRCSPPATVSPSTPSLKEQPSQGDDEWSVSSSSDRSYSSYLTTSASESASLASSELSTSTDEDSLSLSSSSSFSSSRSSSQVVHSFSNGSTVESHPKMVTKLPIKLPKPRTLIKPRTQNKKPQKQPPTNAKSNIKSIPKKKKKKTVERTVPRSSNNNNPPTNTNSNSLYHTNNNGKTLAAFGVTSAQFWTWMGDVFNPDLYGGAFLFDSRGSRLACDLENNDDNANNNKNGEVLSWSVATTKGVQQAVDTISKETTTAAKKGFKKAFSWKNSADPDEPETLYDSEVEDQETAARRLEILQEIERLKAERAAKKKNRKGDKKKKTGNNNKKKKKKKPTVVEEAAGANFVALFSMEEQEEEVQSAVVVLPDVPEPKKQKKKTTATTAKKKTMQVPREQTRDDAPEKAALSEKPNETTSKETKTADESSSDSENALHQRDIYNKAYREAFSEFYNEIYKIQTKSPTLDNNKPDQSTGVETVGEATTVKKDNDDIMCFRSWGTMDEEEEKAADEDLMDFRAQDTMDDEDQDDAEEEERESSTDGEHSSQEEQPHPQPQTQDDSLLKYLFQQEEESDDDDIIMDSPLRQFPTDEDPKIEAPKEPSNQTQEESTQDREVAATVSKNDNDSQPSQTAVVSNHQEITVAVTPEVSSKTAQLVAKAEEIKAAAALAAKKKEEAKAALDAAKKAEQSGDKTEEKLSNNETNDKIPDVKSLLSGETQTERRDGLVKEIAKIKMQTCLEELTTTVIVRNAQKKMAAARALANQKLGDKKLKKAFVDKVPREGKNGNDQVEPLGEIFNVYTLATEVFIHAGCVPIPVDDVLGPIHGEDEDASILSTHSETTCPSSDDEHFDDVESMDGGFLRKTDSVMDPSLFKSWSTHDGKELASPNV